MLPEEAIQEFRKIYKKKFKIALDIKEAEKKANNFIRLADLISNNQTQKVGSLQNSK